MRFNGKRALVTGAGQGIGRCVALALVRAGAAVGFIDKNGAAGRRTAQWIEAAGGEGWFFEGDLADAPQLTAFADAAIARFGQIDLIVNNACYSNGGLRSRCDRDGLMEVLAVGVAAPYELVRLLGGALAPGAAIVNIGSTRAHMSQADS
ncbi:MAG: SDR family oxidoreductase, partial [Clostridiales bacterium]|nr:SDR family oxidoreductase [Clostridiales bacterium]